MDKKGQVNLGLIVMVFITVLVGVVLFQVISQEVGRATTTSEINVTLGAVTNGTDVYMTDWRSISSPIIINGTTGSTIAAGNYTITNNAIDPTTGGLSIRIEPHADSPEVSSQVWNISGTAQPVTYIADSGGRALAGMIAIFFALAIAIIALEPTLRGGILNLIGR